MALASQYTESYFHRQRHHKDFVNNAERKRRYVAVENTFAVERLHLEKPINRSESRLERIDQEDLEFNEDYQIRKQLLAERIRQRELSNLEQLKKKKEKKGLTYQNSGPGVVEGIYAKKRHERIVQARGEELRSMPWTKEVSRRVFEEKLTKFDKNAADYKKKLKNDRKERHQHVFNDDAEISPETLWHWELRDAGKNKALVKEKTENERLKNREQNNERIKREWEERKILRAAEEERMKKLLEERQKRLELERIEREERLRQTKDEENKMREDREKRRKEQSQEDQQHLFEDMQGHTSNGTDRAQSLETVEDEKSRERKRLLLEQRERESRERSAFLREEKERQRREQADRLEQEWEARARETKLREALEETRRKEERKQEETDTLRREEERKRLEKEEAQRKAEDIDRKRREEDRKREEEDKRREEEMRRIQEEGRKREEEAKKWEEEEKKREDGKRKWEEEEQKKREDEKRKIEERERKEVEMWEEETKRILEEDKRREELEKEQKELEQMEEEIREKDKKVDIAETPRSGRRREFTGQTPRGKKALEEEIDFLMDDQEDIKSQLKVSQRNIDDINLDITDIQNELNHLNSLLDEQEDIDDEEIKLSISRKTTELDDLEDDLLAAEEKYARLKKEVDDIQERMDYLLELVVQEEDE